MMTEAIIPNLHTPQDGAPPLSNLEYLTEEEMAAEISNYEKGSVAYLAR